MHFRMTYGEYIYSGDTLKDLQDRTEMARRIRDRTVDNILLRGFVTYFIMICYASLLSQDMSYEISVRQGCSS
jgi:hypothetical protein